MNMILKFKREVANRDSNLLDVIEQISNLASPNTFENDRSSVIRKAGTG